MNKASYRLSCSCGRSFDIDITESNIRHAPEANVSPKEEELKDALRDLIEVVKEYQEKLPLSTIGKVKLLNAQKLLK